MPEMDNDIGDELNFRQIVLRLLGENPENSTWDADDMKLGEKLFFIATQKEFCLTSFYFVKIRKAFGFSDYYDLAPNENENDGDKIIIKSREVVFAGIGLIDFARHVLCFDKEVRLTKLLVRRKDWRKFIEYSKELTIEKYIKLSENNAGKKYAYTQVEKVKEIVALYEQNPFWDRPAIKDGMASGRDATGAASILTSKIADKTHITTRSILEDLIAETLMYGPIF